MVNKNDLLRKQRERYDTGIQMRGQESATDSRNASNIESNDEVDDQQSDQPLKETQKMIKHLNKRRLAAQDQLEDTLQGPRAEEVSEQLQSEKDKIRHLVTEGDVEDGGADNALALSQREEASSPTSATPLASARDGATVSTPRRFSVALTQQIRSRFSEKIRTAKDRGKEEAYEESKLSRQRPGSLQGEPQRTRFDEPMMSDMDTERAVLEKLARARQRDALASSGKRPDEVTDEETYDFFTRVFEPAPVVEEKKAAAEAQPASPAAEGEPPATVPSAEREEEQALLNQLDEVHESFQPYEMAAAFYQPFREKQADEVVAYTYPSVRPAALTEKITEQRLPRYLQDEGLYVGQRPKVAYGNLNKMENRLLQELRIVKEMDDNTKNEKLLRYFGENGSLVTLPDPLINTCTRPPIVDVVPEHLQTDYVKAIVMDDRRTIDSNEFFGVHYQLDVDISAITFTHHHLFSQEHVLASQLLELYQHYVGRSKQDIVKFLSDKLNALKLATEHIGRNIESLQREGSVNNQALADQILVMNNYYMEIKEIRKQRDQEMEKERNLLKSMIKIWKDIKNLRTQQTYTSTTVKLQIIKEPSNKTDDEQEWKLEIDERLIELQADADKAYEKDMENYKKSFEQWQQWKETKAQESKQKKKKRKGKRAKDDDRAEDTEEMIDQDANDSYIAKPQKPVKPDLLNSATARAQIEDQMAKGWRAPGEPKLHLELSQSALVTPTDQCPKQEQQRRNEVNRCKLFARVLFNNKEVSRTPTRQLQQDFTVSFGQLLNIEIIQWPENIKFELYEGAGLGSILLAEIYTSVPEVSVTSVTVQLDRIEFSSTEVIRHSHAGVGSGLLLTGNNNTLDRTIPFISGHLVASVAWSLDSEGNSMAPSATLHPAQLNSALKGVDPIAAIGMSNMANVEKLSQWVMKSRLDPNDPNNADLMFLMQPAVGDSRLRLSDHYRLEQLQEEFNFATDSDLDNSKRFKLIRFRDDEVADFRNMHVPLFEQEVPALIFDEYEKKKKEAELVADLDQLEAHRVMVSRFMQKVKEQVMIRFKHAAHQKTLSDMVNENAVPNIGTIVPELIKLLEPRRPLNPRRTERKKVTAQNIQALDVRILVNVTRAIDIPVRQDAVAKELNMEQRGAMTGDYYTDSNARPTALSPSGPGQMGSQSLVRPFVEAVFQHNTMATSTADGPHPTWNEELQLPFKAPHDDYSPSKLETVNDVLFIGLFDEYVTDLSEDSRSGTTVHQRIEKHLLGSIEIPFSTIYFNSRVEGTFRLRKPPVLLGYTRHIPGNVYTGGELASVNAAGEHTYVHLFITIDPPLTAPEPIIEKMDSIESDQLIIAADRWLGELQRKFPKRPFLVTVVDLNGKTVCVTRFIRRLAPPERTIDSSSSATVNSIRVARFVSKIPFVSDAVTFSALCEMWCTCDQFMEMLQGDEEEHAILLTNYFLHMGKKAWLAIGSAVPEGKTAYVVTLEDSGEYWIWNPNTGEHWKQKDIYCPLLAIGCLIDDTNIWANVQIQEAPSRIGLDVHVTAHWKPFFTNSFPLGSVTSVQPERLVYHDTNPEFVSELQHKIEQLLKEKMQSWRPKNITRFNRYCQSAFKKLLMSLEESDSGTTQQQHIAELDQVLGSYRICGFPLNMTYTDMSKIVETVFATGIHTIESNDIEFALAVHIHPYPNSILSIWIYVAQLARRR